MSKNEFYIQKFMEFKRHKRKRTLDNYRMLFKQYQEYVGSDWPPTPQSLSGFLEYRAEKGDGEATVHVKYRGLKTWVRWLVQNDILATNPFNKFDPPPKGRKNIPRAPTRQDVTTLLDHLTAATETVLKHKRERVEYQTIRDLAVVSLLAGSGLRVGELEAVRCRDFEPQDNRVMLPETKTNVSRYVRISKDVRGDLALWLRVRGLLPVADISTMFVSFDYKRTCWGSFTHWGVRQMLERRCGQCGIEPFGPHSLRHYFAIEALRNGASLLDVKNQLGHLNTTTTNIYTIAAGIDKAILDALPR